MKLSRTQNMVAEAQRGGRTPEEQLAFFVAVAGALVDHVSLSQYLTALTMAEETVAQWRRGDFNSPVV